MSNGDANLNISTCLQSQNNFSETIIHNVCNGAVTTVPWGTADWALAMGACLIFGIMITLILTTILDR